jgi:hypothetical protein
MTIAPDVYASNVRRIGHLDVAGGGQIYVEGTTAFIGHMSAPEGTSLIDVSDPAAPKIVSLLPIGDGSHSHKVRVVGDLMLTNCENANKRSGLPYSDGGLTIWDISDRARPAKLSFFPVPGAGVHRFDFDGRYAYLSSSMAGYRGNIVLILDLNDPRQPAEVSRWWMPGQWTHGGETPSWGDRGVGCHHPLRFGDRLYVGYMHGGVVILDVSNLSSPRLVGHYDYHPAFASISHTFARMPFKLGGRDIAVSVDEQPARPRPGHVPAFMWVFDVTDEAAPTPISTYAMSAEDTPWRDLGSEIATRFGSHQCHERMAGSLVYVAWFRGGLRIVDIADPTAPQTAGYYIPPPDEGRRTVMSNDVFVDRRGYIYLLDRLRGLDILEYVGPPGAQPS